MIEITTIGAGGGSIAQVDTDGILKVGPESAGSDPGPVCYGLGNDYPTVTDANLVLGRINAARPIGGALARLDTDAASRAVLQHVGDPLGLDTMAAAEAILRVANAHMAGAIRLVSIERGHNPTQFAAMPFGGGGALHTGALIQDVGLQAAIVPRYPGITSALGCVVADMRHDRVWTVNQMLADVDGTDLSQRMDEVAIELQQVISQSRIEFNRIDSFFELDMLYAGQTHAVSVPLPTKNLKKEPYSVSEIASAFDHAYERTYGRLLKGITQRVLNYRVVVIGRRPAFDMTILGLGAQPNQSQPANSRAAKNIEYRTVWTDGAQQQVPVYQRDTLSTDVELTGPALVEQPDTTIFIDPGLCGRTDQFGNLIITRKGDE